MLAILNFKQGKNVYEIVQERGSWWIVLENVGRCELQDSEIIYKAETIEELEDARPEYFL